MSTQRRVTVPKINSQVGNAALYETLKDIVAKIANRINESETYVEGLIEDITTGGGTLFPFYVASGAYNPIPLVPGSWALPFYVASGVSADIPVVV